MIRGLWGLLCRKCHRCGVSRKCPNDLFCVMQWTNCLHVSLSQIKKAYISHLMHSMAHRKDGHLGLIRLCITRINKMYWNSHAILQQWQGFLIRINVKWGRSEEKWEYGHKFFLRVTPLRINYTQVHACISFFNIGKFYKNLKKNRKDKQELIYTVDCSLLNNVFNEITTESEINVESLRLSSFKIQWRKWFFNIKFISL